MVEVCSGKPGWRDGSHEAEIKELHAKIGEAERRGQAVRLRAAGSGSDWSLGSRVMGIR